ncbi:MAG: SsrA-binding protein SmpB [Thauera sp.]
MRAEGSLPAARPKDRHTMSIIENRKAFHDYFIEEKHEAGMVLEGWEVKAIRAGRSNIKESYVVIRGEEIFLFGMHITPLTTASSHVHHDPTRTRKLLLHKKEIARLIGKVERAGYTLVPLDMHYKKGLIKLEIGLAKGKKLHDKREDEKKKDWEREKQRLMRVKA